jgi:hypothetical protein
MFSTTNSRQPPRIGMQCLLRQGTKPCRNTSSGPKNPSSFGLLRRWTIRLSSVRPTGSTPQLPNSFPMVLGSEDVRMGTNVAGPSKRRHSSRLHQQHQLSRHYWALSRCQRARHYSRCRVVPATNATSSRPCLHLISTSRRRPYNLTHLHAPSKQSPRRSSGIPQTPSACLHRRRPPRLKPANTHLSCDWLPAQRRPKYLWPRPTPAPSRTTLPRHL